jgi:fatty-acyl-CoA synthase
VAGDDPVILQLTSGTTDSAKTVRISHANLAANLEAIKKATNHEAVHGRMLSWLPLSHDMGLIGSLLMPLSCGRCEVILSSPAEYLARPAEWMRNISRLRATSTAAPNSAYALASKLLTTGPDLDLSAMRCALFGGEPIDPEVVEEFTVVAARHRFDPGAIVPAYGLAEATVAVTLAPIGRGLRCDTIDADTLTQHGWAEPVHQNQMDRHGKSPRSDCCIGSPGVDGCADADGGGRPATSSRTYRLPLLGPPIDGLELQVVDPTTGIRLPDRRVGEVRIRGTSVTTGYHNDPDATAALLGSGWLHTGDLGYLVNGELVIVGRSKDVIIIAGRNIYPDEVERAAARAHGVRPGSVVAFACRRPGLLVGEGLAVAVETRSDKPDQIRTAVADQVRQTLGLIPHSVLVLPPGSIPKTPSGKPQRSEVADKYSSLTNG